MEAILYTKKNSAAGCRLQRMIESNIEDLDLKVLRTMKTLISELIDSRSESVRIVAVLVADNRQDLLDFLSISQFLSDIWTILVLPNRDREITSKAFLLRPRFISYVDDDFSNTVAVLAKMLEQARTQSLQLG